MHIHQQNHWNGILFYWYQSYHWYQWTIGLTNRIRLCILDMCGDTCREKYYFRSRVLDASVECRLLPENVENVRQPRNLWSSRIKTKNRWPRALSIQPKSPEIPVGSSNVTDHFGLVRPEYSGPALRVVHCDRSGHFGRSDRNVPFHLPKLFSPVPLFSIRLTGTSSFQ